MTGHYKPARDFEEFDARPDHYEPRLETPEIASLVDLADAAASVGGTDRAVMLNAMRKAAEKRIASVTENKRRRHYEHAAALALTCVKIDPSGSSAWMAKIRSAYSRYPALQHELVGRR